MPRSPRYLIIVRLCAKFTRPRSFRRANLPRVESTANNSDLARRKRRIGVCGYVSQYGCENAIPSWGRNGKANLVCTRAHIENKRLRSQRAPRLNPHMTLAKTVRRVFICNWSNTLLYICTFSSRWYSLYFPDWPFVVPLVSLYRVHLLDFSSNSRRFRASSLAERLTFYLFRMEPIREPYRGW